MNLFARLFGLTALFIALMIPTLAAQEKKDAKKDDKAEVKKDAKDTKDDPKKAAKDDDKKKTDKKTDKTDKSKEEEKIVYGSVVQAKLSRVEASSKGGFGIQPVDPTLVAKLNYWMNQQMISIASAQNAQDRFNRMRDYQNALPGQQATIYGKEIEVKPADKMKIRTMFPPTKYDDQGNMVKWTDKTLKELRGSSKLAGYPAEMDALKAGQVVDIYFAKVTPPSGGKGKKKTIDDELDAAMNRPEIVLIIVKMEAPMRK